ncbi:hypothetical protein [Simiduia agarivorans]|uniref:Uncharacterized protein n=1 Tax=Simiduia agarivorans (strain DSM 21679 / JCM 13881 / BCRC 17597 / SA1) TaxID=1117647 RepID=K4KL96_SIMAS|nr:hypothetical protein [Simiduia agarivorans]AFU99529.1 hypothetical protein M5M_11760 [Simiduia agarivorans SA1 = DSM 21679]AFU99934.1 hypothetical protein M5M_13980 [Simiduia agarivorans SA1 = DSM 21679]
MEQIERWALIEAELMAAFVLLPETTVESDCGYRKDDFLSYIKANELLLAMEELDGVIEDNPSPSSTFWLHLINASKLMDCRHLERYELILNAT